VRIRLTLIAGIATSALVLVPPIDSIIRIEPAAYMASHYVIYGLGIVSGARIGKGGAACLAVGIAIAVLWHLPWTFALGAANTLIRALDAATNLVGGICMGMYAASANPATQLVLLALYMGGDSYLAAIFYSGGIPYSNASIPYSPYPPNSFANAAILMFAASAIAFLVSLTIIVRELGEESEVEKRL